MTKRLILIIIIIAVLACIIINLPTFFRIYQGKTDISKYLEIKEFEDARELFKRDLQKNELKYFYFGLGEDSELIDSFETNYDLNVIWLGDIIRKNLCFYNHFVELELFGKSYTSQSWGWGADSIWQNFNKLLENMDINGLNAISFDSIFCRGINISSFDKTEIFNSTFLFDNHLNQLFYPEIYSTHNCKKFETDSIIQVTFFESSNMDLTYMFEKKNGKYLFRSIFLN